MYASGVSDYVIADIWINYPYVQSSGELYSIIKEMTKGYSSSTNLFTYSIEAFLRFDLLSSLILLFFIPIKSYKADWFNKKIILRLLSLIFVFTVLIFGNLFFQIQTINNETRFRCYEAHYTLYKNNSIDENKDSAEDELNTYLLLIQKEKDKYGKNLYFGVFDIRVPVNEYIKNVICEFHRF